MPKGIIASDRHGLLVILHVQTWGRYEPHVFRPYPSIPIGWGLHRFGLPRQDFPKDASRFSVGDRIRCRFYGQRNSIAMIAHDDDTPWKLSEKEHWRSHSWPTQSYFPETLKGKTETHWRPHGQVVNFPSL